jgi:ubiquinone/menaquinone biosynthesis C-methylase UbiE
MQNVRIDMKAFLSATPQSLDGLSWYDITGRLGLLSFNSQGAKPMDLIAREAGISASSAVLMLGCGAGATAVHLADATGAVVHGIDLSDRSIQAARRLAARSPSAGRLRFDVADAHALPFADASFDVAVTEYMAFFLRPEAFAELFRVLRPGGRLAMAELMKDHTVPHNADARIRAAEETYSRVIGYAFHVPTDASYAETLARVGFTQPRIVQRFTEPGLREKVRAAGGVGNLLAISRVVVRLMRVSPRLRSMFIQVGAVKRTLVERRSTARYIFQGVMMGRKP